MSNLIFDYKALFNFIDLIIVLWSAIIFIKFRKSNDIVSKTRYLIASIYLLIVGLFLFITYPFYSNILNLISFIPYPFSFLLLGLAVYLLFRALKCFIKYLVTKHYVNISNQISSSSLD
jgi:hypothetical protein